MMLDACRAIVEGRIEIQLTEETSFIPVNRTKGLSKFR